MRQVKLTFVLIFSIHQITQILCDCGRPGYSRNSAIVDSRHRYAEGRVVRYRCKSPGNSLVYGYRERKCENNRWLDSIPKCAAKIPNSKVKKYIRNEVIVISTNTAAKLVGFRLKISARVDIEIDEVKHLIDYNCTRSMGPTKDSYLQKNFIFTCVSLVVDSNDFKDTNFIIVKFTHSLECPPICKANVEQFELFRVGRDDCFIPDRPDYGSSRLVKFNDSDYGASEVRHTFNCNPDFQMRESRNNEDFCPIGGDWQYPPLPQCIPLSTCKLPDIAENVVIDYTDLFQRNRYVIGGVIKYSCAGTDILSGSPVQECLQNGTWSGNKPKCIPLVAETSNTALYIIIACTILVPIAIVVAVLVGFICFRHKKPNAIGNVSTKESSFKYQNKNRELPKKPSTTFEAADPRYSTIERNFYDDIEIDPNYDYIQPANTNTHTNNALPVKYDTPRTPSPMKTVFF